MRKNSRFMLAAGLIGLVLTTSSFAEEKAKPAEPNGHDLAFDKKKGNCLACHLMPGVHDAITNTTIGPPLVGMKARFPDKAKLRAQVWDATKANPNTSMPPFGKHQILSEQEIDKIVDFVYGI